MAESNWLRHAVRAGAFEFRRSARAIREDTARLVLLGISVVFPTLLLAGMAALFGSAIRGDVPTDLAVPDAVRGGTALFWLFGVFLLAQRAATAYDELVAEPFVLTTVSARTAVVGGVVAETLRVAAYGALPMAVLLPTAAYVLGSPATLVVVPVVAALFVGSAVVAGRVTGYTAAWLVARVPFVARHRTALSAVVAIGFFGGYMLFQLPMLPYSLDPALLGLLPVGWLVDLAVVGTPIRYSGSRLLGGVVVAGGTILGGSWAATLVASSLWYGDEVAPDDGHDEPVAVEDRTGTGALARSLSPLSVPLLDGPSRTVARWTLLRARREPQRLNFLMVPVFGGGSAVLNLLLQGSASLSVLGPATALVGGWVAGAAFALNPLGDEGPVLPMTLTSVPSRAYVRGLIAPVLLSAPAVTLLTLAVSLGTGTAPVTALALGVAGAVVAGVGAALAPLLGMWFPRYSAIRIGSSDDVRPPRLFAGALHFGLVAVPGTALVGALTAPGVVRAVLAGLISVPGLLAGLYADGGAIAAIEAGFVETAAAVGSLPVAIVGVGMGALLVVSGVLTALVAYRLAVRRVDEHEPY
ncbi:hypothetical protein JCM30237_04450 [Halolamina litorea]|uniref:ABC-2 type transport system permease protein n=1 Tax=Halolamina litorea TaxID=1515593 RepID=A0ABD6BPE1_9EURY|nr:hypothetical protein [Halolamina litorea]